MMGKVEAFAGNVEQLESKVERDRFISSSLKESRTSISKSRKYARESGSFAI